MNCLWKRAATTCGRFSPPVLLRTYASMRTSISIVNKSPLVTTPGKSGRAVIFWFPKRNGPPCGAVRITGILAFSVLCSITDDFQSTPGSKDVGKVSGMLLSRLWLFSFDLAVIFLFDTLWNTTSNSSTERLLQQTSYLSRRDCQWMGHFEIAFSAINVRLVSSTPRLMRMTNIECWNRETDDWKLNSSCFVFIEEAKSFHGMSNGKWDSGIIPDQIPAGTWDCSQSSSHKRKKKKLHFTFPVLGIRGFLLLGWKMENIAKWNA